MDANLASDAEITQLITALSTEGSDDLVEIDRLLDRYKEDPRLYFMRGSVLAGLGRAIEAHSAMARAIEIAPGYALARYQLGFFELTSGEADRALSTWGPLFALGDDNYLRVFAEGMTHLIRDEFAAAIEKFQAGLALNQENEPMNHDIRLLIAECRKLMEGQNDSSSGDDEISATALLLGQLGPRTIQ